jgi:hypothetical protein
MTRIMIGVALAALGGAMAAGPALAVEFKDADADSNGAVTMAEAQAAMPDLTPDEFAQADRNGDGMLTRAEYATLTRA